MINRNNLKKIVLESKYREFEQGIQREILPIISKNINSNEIIVISGIRRSGKTTLLYQLLNLINKPENVLYINFEDERLIDFTVTDFERLLEVFYEVNSPQGTIYLFFDEIQEIENWEKWVRRVYDNNRNIKFFISGSNSSLLSSEFSTLLTGRNISYTLYPFSFKEYLIYNRADYSNKHPEIEVKTRAQIIKYLNFYIENGGFPAVSQKYRIDLLQQYFKDIIYRDVVKRYKIRDVKLIEELFLFLITNTSNLYSYNKLKNTFKMGIDTVKEYISYGLNAYLFYEHIFFSYSLKEAFQKNRKIYSIDTGLRNAIAFKFSEDTGRLTENVVFIELLRKNKDIYYYSDRNEVDFVIKERDNTISLINVSFSDNIPERERKGFYDFKANFEDKKISRKIIITREYEDLIDDVEFVPLWKWLLG